MKLLVGIIILLGIGYFLFQPTIDRMFGSVSSQYSSSVDQNEALSD